jgi:hypothetical protein
MSADSIRVLSIRQPFADEVIFGDKWNEIRSWRTPLSWVALYSCQPLGRVEIAGNGGRGGHVGNHRTRESGRLPQRR